MLTQQRYADGVTLATVRHSRRVILLFHWNLVPVYTFAHNQRRRIALLCQMQWFTKIWFFTCKHRLRLAISRMPLLVEWAHVKLVIRNRTHGLKSTVENVLFRHLHQLLVHLKQGKPILKIWLCKGTSVVILNHWIFTSFVSIQFLLYQLCQLNVSIATAAENLVDVKITLIFIFFMSWETKCFLCIPSIAYWWIFAECCTQCGHLLSNTFHVGETCRCQWWWIQNLEGIRRIQWKNLATKIWNEEDFKIILSNWWSINRLSSFMVKKVFRNKSTTNYATK